MRMEIERTISDIYAFICLFVWVFGGGVSVVQMWQYGTAILIYITQQNLVMY